MDDLWSCDGEVPWTYALDGCEAWVDWLVGEKSLKRPTDILDEIDYDKLYLQDYDDEMLELESSTSSVYDRLRATPASMTLSTNMEVATKMFGLSIDTPGILACSTPETLRNLWIQIPAVRSMQIAPPVDQFEDLDAAEAQSRDESLGWQQQPLAQRTGYINSIPVLTGLRYPEIVLTLRKQSLTIPGRI